MGYGYLYEEYTAGCKKVNYISDYVIWYPLSFIAVTETGLKRVTPKTLHKLLKGKFRSSSVRSAPGVGYHHNVKLKLDIMFLICYIQTAVGDFLNFS